MNKKLTCCISAAMVAAMIFSVISNAVCADEVVSNDDLLKAFAWNSPEILSNKSQNADHLLYYLADVTDDGENDLIVYDGSMFFEVYTNINGNITQIDRGHNMVIEGYASFPAKYNNKYYISYASASISPTLGEEFGLRVYRNGQWEWEYSAHYEFDGTTTKYVVNDEYVDKSVYDDFANSYTCVSPNEFMTLEELCANNLDIKDNDDLLRRYAAENLLVFVPGVVHRGVTYKGEEVRYLLADVTGDNQNELIIAGIVENEFADFAVYAINNGRIEEIYTDNMFAYGGWRSWPAIYEGKYYIVQEGYKPSNSCKKLVHLKGQHCLPEAYYYITDVDKDEEGHYLWESYRLNGEPIDEETYKYYEDLIMNQARRLTIDDFMTLEELLATKSTDDTNKYGYVDVMPVSRQEYDDRYEIIVKYKNNSSETITNKRIQLACTTITNTKTKQQDEIVIAHLEHEQVFEPYEEKISGALVKIEESENGLEYTMTDKPYAKNYVIDHSLLDNMKLLTIQFDNDKEYDEFMESIEANHITDLSTEEYIKNNVEWLKKLKEDK